MVKRACRCGRILYENTSTCPSCGRDMTQAPIVFKILKSREPSGGEPELTWDFKKQRCQVFIEVTLDDELDWDFDDVPDWLDFELSEVGMACVFDVHDREKFALEHGLCPGQSFTIIVWPPEYYQDYWGEWDVDYQWELWGATPLPMEVHLERWLEWFERGQDEDYIVRHRLALETLAKGG